MAAARSRAAGDVKHRARRWPWCIPLPPDAMACPHGDCRPARFIARAAVQRTQKRGCWQLHFLHLATRACGCHESIPVGPADGAGRAPPGRGGGGKREKKGAPVDSVRYIAMCGQMVVSADRPRCGMPGRPRHLIEVRPGPEGHAELRPDVPRGSRSRADRPVAFGIGETPSSISELNKSMISLTRPDRTGFSIAGDTRRIRPRQAAARRLAAARNR